MMHKRNVQKASRLTFPWCLSCKTPLELLGLSTLPRQASHALYMSSQRTGSAVPSKSQNHPERRKSSAQLASLPSQMTSTCTAAQPSKVSYFSCTVAPPMVHVHSILVLYLYNDNHPTASRSPLKLLPHAIICAGIRHKFRGCESRANWLYKSKRLREHTHFSLLWMIGSYRH